MEVVNESLKEQEYSGEALVIKGLKKIYRNKTIAVDGLDITFYKS